MAIYCYCYYYLLIDYSKDVVINHVADIVAQNLNHTLFVVGTYTIGKERVIVKLVETFNLKVFARPAKYVHSHSFSLIVNYIINHLKGKECSCNWTYQKYLMIV